MKKENVPDETEKPPKPLQNPDEVITLDEGEGDEEGDSGSNPGGPPPPPPGTKP